MINVMSGGLRTFSTIENFIVRAPVFRPLLTPTPHPADRSAGYMLIGVRGVLLIGVRGLR